MDWEKKTEMIRLHNTEENPHIWQNYARLYVDEFDAQAWDMFINLVSLVPDDMRKSKEFYAFMYEKLHEHKINEIELSFRSALRFSMLEAICEEELGCEVIEW
jgi:hypothetical protein